MRHISTREAATISQAIESGGPFRVTLERATEDVYDAVIRFVEDTTGMRQVARISAWGVAMGHYGEVTRENRVCIEHHDMTGEQGVESYVTVSRGYQ